jgi:hypothetical protein
MGGPTVQRLRRLQVVAERLLDHDPARPSSSGLASQGRAAGLGF